MGFQLHGKASGLKLGLVCAQTIDPSWLQSFAEGLAEDGHGVIAVDAASDESSLFWDGVPTLRASSILYRAFECLERMLLRRGKWRRADVSPDAAIPATSRMGLGSELRGYGCDLILDLRLGGAEAIGSSRLGVLSFRVGERGSGLPCHREMARGEHAVRISSILTRATGGAVEVCDAWVPLHGFSLSRSLEACASRLATLARKSVRMIAAALSLEGAPSGRDAEGAAGEKGIGSWVALPLFRKAFAHIIERGLRRLLFREQWIVSVSRGSGEDFRSFDPGGGAKLVPPKDRDWADPFPVARGGKTWLFFEEQIVGRPGRISCFELKDDGSRGDPMAILEKPYHLSYPYIFEQDRELYLVPESGENKTIDLYRCVEFPVRWEHAATLIDGIEAVDTSLLYRGGTWWLFTNTRADTGYSRNEELYLFRSDSLLSGSWQAHALNPVVTDVRSARGAGRIFEEGGRLFRPAQDCSRSYGYAVSINEITALGDEEYREERRALLSPEKARGLIALHTFNRAGGITVVDGKILRSRILDKMTKGPR